MDRREVLALLAAVSAAPAMALVPEPSVLPREPWGRFAAGPQFKPLLAAIRKLKAGSDLNSPDCWLFWANIHQAHCPHGKPYFLAWHRGYLWLFEKKLRQLSGLDALRLPYWDYFALPEVPGEFLGETMDGAPNPLWEPRKGSSVRAALGYAPFDKSVVNFARGEKDAFEAKLESSPHNNIHNLIGGKMATMQSPQDMLFWVHHCNVDRLWSAWLAAGQGRKMPAPEAAYWNATLDYAGGMAIDRREVIACEHLGYRYADLALPKPLPPAPPQVRSAAPSGGAMPPPPPRVGAVRPPPMTQMPMGVAPGDMFGRSKSLLLSEGAVTVNVALPFATEGGAARPPIPRVGAAPGVAMPNRAEPEKELTVILDDVSLTARGMEGGFFYKVYLDLPGMPGVGREERLLGTIGPFQIATAQHGTHHGPGHESVQLTLPATDLVRRLARGRDFASLGQLSVSFVRVDAEDAPDGPVIGIGTFRIQEGRLD